MKAKPCCCLLAGFCHRHINTSVEKKDEFLYNLCKTSPKYRKLWDDLAKKAKRKKIKKVIYSGNEELDKIKIARFGSKFKSLDILYLTIISVGIEHNSKSFVLEKKNDVWVINNIEFGHDGEFYLRVEEKIYKSVPTTDPFYFVIQDGQTYYAITE